MATNDEIEWAKCQLHYCAVSVHTKKESNETTGRRLDDSLTRPNEVAHEFFLQIRKITALTNAICALGVQREAAPALDRLKWRRTVTTGVNSHSPRPLRGWINSNQKAFNWPLDSGQPDETGSDQLVSNHFPFAGSTFRRFTRLICISVQVNCTPVDSPFHVLSKFFWVQLHPVDGSAAEWRGSRKMARISAFKFREFAAERLVRSSRTQKPMCWAFKEQPTDRKSGSVGLFEIRRTVSVCWMTQPPVRDVALRNALGRPLFSSSVALIRNKLQIQWNNLKKKFER